MSADTPKPLEDLEPAPKNADGAASPEEGGVDPLEYTPEGAIVCKLISIEEPKEEGRSLEVVQGPKGKLADLIDKTLEENSPVSATPKNDRPEAAIPLTQPTISPNYLEKTGHASELTSLDRMRQIAWAISGVIIRHKYIEKDLLAVMLVSKDMKASALDSPNGSLDIEPLSKPKIVLEAYEKIRELRDGLYLVLKLDGAKPFVLGGERAESVAPEAIESGYREIASVRKFFKRSDKIEKGSAGNMDSDANGDDE